MTNKVTIPDHIRSKIKEADEAPRKILDLCCQQLVHPQAATLREISSRLGSMSQLLRSALNNMMWDFVEIYLKSKISSKDYDAIKWSHDFPIEANKTNFAASKSRILRHIKELHPQTYHYLDLVQPYYRPNHLLWALKLLSNDSAHTIPVQVLQPNISSVVFAHGGKPQVIGKNVIIPVDPSNPLVLNIPCFIESMDMFVSEDGKWQIFMIDLDLDPKYSVTRFIERAAPLITGIIEGFYALPRNAG
jgi:hypothetical protein